MKIKKPIDAKAFKEKVGRKWGGIQSMMIWIDVIVHQQV